MLLSVSAQQQNLHSVVDKTVYWGADGPVFKHRVSQAAAPTFFSSFQLNSLNRPAARSPHFLTTVLDLFLLPRHPSDSNPTLSYIAVAVSASEQSQIEPQVGFLLSETRCTWHRFRQYSMSFSQGWKLLKLEGTSLGRPRVQPPSSPMMKDWRTGL